MENGRSFYYVDISNNSSKAKKNLMPILSKEDDDSIVMIVSAPFAHLIYSQESK